MSAQSDSATMPHNRSRPPGTIIPELVYEDLAIALPWLCQAFGLKERLRIGGHRAQLVFGGASVVAVAHPVNYDAPATAMPGLQPIAAPLTHLVMVRVEQVDQHYEHARQNGARILHPPETYPFGERQYTAEDPGGHRWTFSQSVADVAPEDWGGQLMIKE